MLEVLDNTGTHSWDAQEKENIPQYFVQPPCFVNGCGHPIFFSDFESNHACNGNHDNATNENETLDVVELLFHLVLLLGEG
jgi:hypothetical protein